MDMLLQIILQGGGTAAGVATVGVLLNIRSEFRSLREEDARTKVRVGRLERAIWPDVFGGDSADKP